MVVCACDSNLRQMEIRGSLGFTEQSSWLNWQGSVRALSYKVRWRVTKEDKDIDLWSPLCNRVFMHAYTCTCTLYPRVLA